MIGSSLVTGIFSQKKVHFLYSDTCFGALYAEVEVSLRKITLQCNLITPLRKGWPLPQYTN